MSSSSEHQMADNDDFQVTATVKRDFDTNGYVLVRGLLTEPEVSRMRECAEGSEDIARHSYGRADGKGRTSRLCIWNYEGDDVLGVAARLQKVAGTMQSLFGGDEIYHYHSKLMMKDALTGGSFVWHQDYGYWYGNGCLTPEMGSIFMPLDKCRRENGCLQVLKGSHKMGRVDHVLTGEQAGADFARVELAKANFEHVYVEMDPGDVLFFHSNLLHTSDQNRSEMRRWAMITAVNKRSNEPAKQHHHAPYHPLRLLPNHALRTCTRLNFDAKACYCWPPSLHYSLGNRLESSEEKDFINPTEDSSHRVGNQKTDKDL